MLEIVIVVLEGSKRNGESHRNVGLEDCTFWEDLEYGHVLTVQVLSFLGYPAQRQLCLHFVGYFDLSLAADCQYVAVSEVEAVVAETDQLIVFTFEKELLLEDVGVLSDLEVCLVKVLLGVAFLCALFGQFEKQVIFNVFQFDSRDSAFDDSLPEGVNMLLNEGKRSDQQIVAGSDEIDIQENMISHKAVDSLIVGNCVSRSEFDDDFGIGITSDGPFGFIEKEDIVRVGKKLVICVQL